MSKEPPDVGGCGGRVPAGHRDGAASASAGGGATDSGRGGPTRAPIRSEVPHPGRGRGGAAPLGPVLDALLARLGLATQVRRHRALRLWDQVVGPVIAARARPYRLTGDVLWVAVRHPGWAQELAYLKATILRDLNAAVGGPALRDLRFTTGPGPRQGPARPTTTRGAAVPRSPACGDGVGQAAATRAPDGAAAPETGMTGPPVTAPRAAASQARPAPGPPSTGSSSPRGEGAGGAAAGACQDAELQAAAARWLQAARRRRRWALERGWQPCASCGSLYPPHPGRSMAVAGAGRHGGNGSPRLEASSGEALCPACRAARQEALRLRIRTLLERDPWLACGQVAAALGEPVEAVARLYREERTALQEHWRARLRVAATRLRKGEPPAAETRSLLLRYALLRTGADPGRLDGAAAREALGPRLAPLWDACFGPPSAGSGPSPRRPAASPRPARRGARPPAGSDAGDRRR
ncbi:DUF721 domain-containing protein [Thermaerobacter sp. FW80]|uniref:DciA family protein n=1 Tax=Thermaerobacter sp. FW80 TaxID=2546351 RepID=UPI001074D6E6|nr:DciA family protein [Thermaerobacter sp. FW80]QBS37102.1 DUF721 domain-containing protein [Thermaerobacter sp. FW80]